mgnify:CR=1 FL=1
MAEYVNVKIPKKLAEKIDKVIELGLEGYRSRGEFVTTAVREKLKEYKDKLSPRLEHFNVYEDHVTIWDNLENRLVDVYFQKGKAYCQYCDAHECEHTRFALSIPKVVKALREKGWIIEDGKVIRGPF